MKKFFDSFEFNFQNAFCLMVLGMSIGGLVFVAYKPPKVESGTIVAFFIFAGTTAINFVIGSSKGSARKSETINDLVRPPDGKTILETKSPDG